MSKLRASFGFAFLAFNEVNGERVRAYGKDVVAAGPDPHAALVALIAEAAAVKGPFLVFEDLRFKAGDGTTYVCEPALREAGRGVSLN